MAAWTRIMGWKSGPGELYRRNAAVRTWARYGFYYLFGTAMGAGRLFSGMGPFGIAAVAAAGGDVRGLACLGGVVTGYSLAGGFFDGIRYIATAVMVYTVGFIARGGKLRDRRWFLPLTAAVLTCGTGLMYTGHAIGGIPGFMRLFLEVILSGGCALLFGFALSPERRAGEAAELRRSISVAVACACGLMGLSSIKLWGVLAVGRFLAILAVMAAGFCGGPLTGCAAGAAMGLGMD